VDLVPGDKVAVVADVAGTCLRGSKQFQGETCFVGNGVAKVSRGDLFKTSEVVKGVGVEVTERLYDCPSLDEKLFSGCIMLQNLPSIMAVDLLDPQPGELVLDMCAAPGGKTTHLAQRMKNVGKVVAFDKSRNKIDTVKKNCDSLGVDIVKAFVMDGTKACCDEINEESPPYPSEYFDRILVDAPCSGLGQRPQFYNKMKLKELNSFPKIQKKLFATAVQLLKPGGTLVYSTCTNNIEENEKIVQWAMSTFDNLEQIALYDDLNSGCLNFGHPSFKIDTISFFISKFTKKVTILN